MRVFNLLLLFLSQAFADTSQGFLVTLGGHPELSDLVSQIKSFPQLLQELVTADNFTFIAPTNKALSTWRLANHSQDFLEIVLTYHLLRGIHASTSLKSHPKIILTALTNATYSSVTGGQRVKASYDRRFVLDSGLQNSSNVITPVSFILATPLPLTNPTKDIPTLGGLIHVVDTVLDIPLDMISTLPQANLSYTIELLSKGNYFNLNNNAFSTQLAFLPDLTMLMPNSAAAVANFNTTGKTQAELDKQIEYHLLDGLVYSTDFSNGTELLTRNGHRILITVDEEGSVFVNSAKITAFDFFTQNGVFHIIDDVLNPNNISRPILGSNQSVAVAPSPTPTSTAGPTPTGTASPATSTSTSLATGTKIGIGVGAGAAVVALIAAGVIACRRRRVTRAYTNPNSPVVNFGELSGGFRYEVVQLETREQAFELPAEINYTIGRAI